MPQIQITAARSKDELDTVAALFHAYAASLPIDLDYQDVNAEVVGLPGRYALSGDLNAKTPAGPKPAGASK